MAVGGFFTGILCGPFTGWVADRFSGRACWSGSLAVSSLCVAVIAFFPHPVTIVAMSVLNGAAGNLTNAAEFKLLPKAPGYDPVERIRLYCGNRFVLLDRSPACGCLLRYLEYDRHYSRLFGAPAGRGSHRLV